MTITNTRTAVHALRLDRNKVRRVGLGATGAFLLTAASSACAGDFATSVIDYTPAPGVFINDSMFNDPDNALGAPGDIVTGGEPNNNAKQVSLGGFGGSITLAFDETVDDHPANAFGMDAIVFGNGFYVGGDPIRRFAEPAHIEISIDTNDNGIADDTWYLIKGSSLPSVPSTVYRTEDWDDNAGTGTLPDDVDNYPDPLIYPGIGSTYTTGAFELPAAFETTVLENPNGSSATAEGYWGYADSTPITIRPSSVTVGEFYTQPDDPLTVGLTAGSCGGDAFDIAWAVDPDTGDAANLSGFDFIRITTAVQFESALFSELSAEVAGVSDVRPEFVFGDLNDDGYVNSSDLAILIAAFGSTNSIADLNGDGIVDSADLAILLMQYS